jgi:hypothetical protein
MLIKENIGLPRAHCLIHVERAYDFNEKPGLFVYRVEDDDVESLNEITNAGRVRLHTFCYNTASRANGLNYVALSNDGTAPAASDTALTSELTGNGLDRAQGTVTLATGAGNQTTIQKVFTYLGGGSQAVQKTALFDAAGPPVAGVMAHEIQFTQRTLFTNDTLTVTFTITLG